MTGHTRATEPGSRPAAASPRRTAGQHDVVEVGDGAQRVDEQAVGDLADHLAHPRRGHRRRRWAGRGASIGPGDHIGAEQGERVEVAVEGELGLAAERGVDRPHRLDVLAQAWDPGG